MMGLTQDFSRQVSRCLHLHVQLLRFEVLLDHWMVSIPVFCHILQLQSPSTWQCTVLDGYLLLFILATYPNYGTLVLANCNLLFITPELQLHLYATDTCSAFQVRDCQAARS